MSKTPVGINEDFLGNHPNDITAMNFAIGVGWVKTGMRYWNYLTNSIRVWDGVNWNSGVLCNTLEQAYNQGGPGSGRIINAIYGAVQINNNNPDITNTLELYRTIGTGMALAVYGNTQMSGWLDCVGGANNWFRPPQMNNTEETTMLTGFGPSDAGKIWYNTSTNVLKMWNGSAFVIL